MVKFDCFDHVLLFIFSD